ncbi:transposase domain-containing protein [Streptomyces sp. NPDC052069]|uniref:transposase domain-containing protein n=1 Tax=Streptomyces sp. NPDC052069 TaxID=3154650 RepID=UPI003440D9B0
MWGRPDLPPCEAGPSQPLGDRPHAGEQGFPGPDPSPGSQRFRRSHKPVEEYYVEQRSSLVQAVVQDSLYPRSSVAVSSCPFGPGGGHHPYGHGGRGPVRARSSGGTDGRCAVRLVDAVLLETRSVQRRLRDLPSRVGVYFLLAMCLFPEVGYRLVWDKLTAGLAGMPVVCPTPKALRDLRRRLGYAPVRALLEVLAGPLAQPMTPGVRFGPFQTVSFDGCSSQKVADSERNRVWLGRTSHHGYPTMELMTLVETGTRALIGAVFGPPAGCETGYASRLLHLLRPDMLVLWDKGFDGNGFLAAVRATGPGTGPAPRQPSCPGPGTSGRRYVPVGDRHRESTCRRREHHGDLRGRHGLHRFLPPGHHPDRRPALPGGHAGGPLPPVVGTRIGVLRAPPHHHGRARPALGRPGRCRAGNVGSAHALPGPADCDGRGRRVPARHRPGPLLLHRRRPGRRRPPHRPRGRPLRRTDRGPDPDPSPPTPAAAGQHPQGQVTDVPLQHPPRRRQARYQPHHHRSRHQRPRALRSAPPAPRRLPRRPAHRPPPIAAATGSWLCSKKTPPASGAPATSPPTSATSPWKPSIDSSPDGPRPASSTRSAPGSTPPRHGHQHPLHDLRKR